MFCLPLQRTYLSVASFWLHLSQIGSVWYEDTSISDNTSHCPEPRLLSGFGNEVNSCRWQETAILGVYSSLNNGNQCQAPEISEFLKYMNIHRWILQDKLRVEGWLDLCGDDLNCIWENLKLLIVLGNETLLQQPK